MTEFYRNPFWQILRGWSLFPLRHNSKRPIGSWGDYMFERASTAQMSAWADKYENLGVVTGSISGLVVVDIDDDDAFEWCERNGGLPTTVTIRTPRGYHLYYAHPNITISNSASKLAPGVDIRGDGGFVVGPHSCFVPTAAEAADGKIAGVYYPVPTMGPGEVPLTPLPAWIMDRLTIDRHEPPMITRPTTVADITSTASAFPPAYVESIVRGEITRIESAAKGTRNQQLFMASDRLARLVAAGAIEDHVAKDELRSAARTIGLLSEEIETTINSGFRHGLSKPKMLPQQVAPQMSAATARKLLKAKGKK